MLVCVLCVCSWSLEIFGRKDWELDFDSLSDSGDSMILRVCIDSKDAPEWIYRGFLDGLVAP